jgi:hypothetical protein
MDQFKALLFGINPLRPQQSKSIQTEKRNLVDLVLKINSL